MKIERIAETVCPFCGSPAIREEVRPGRHVNGEQFESRAFQCGIAAEYIPNFERVEWHGRCGKSPAEIERKGRVIRFLADLLVFVKGYPQLTKEEREIAARMVKYELARAEEALEALGGGACSYAEGAR